LRLKKSIKSKGIIIVVSISSLLFVNRIAHSEEKRTFKPELNINLMVGYRFMNVGDLNTYLKSYDKFLTETSSYQGGQINTLHDFPEAGLAVSWDLSSQWAIEAELDFLSKKKESSFDFTEDVLPYPYYREYYIEQKIKVWPLTLRGRYLVLSGPKLQLSLNLGLTYSISKCYLSVWESSPLMPPPVLYSVKSHGPGLIGGIGLEHKLNSFLALIVEAQGRYSKLRKLKGTTSGAVEDGEGALYIGEKYNSQYDRFEPCLITSSSMPASDEFRNMRKAALDLSGFSLKLGFRIRLF